MNQLREKKIFKSLHYRALITIGPHFCRHWGQSLANYSLALITWGLDLRVSACPSPGVHKLPRHLVTEKVRFSLRPLFLTHGAFFIVHSSSSSLNVYYKPLCLFP